MATNKFKTLKQKTVGRFFLTSYSYNRIQNEYPIRELFDKLNLFHFSNDLLP